MTMLFLGVGLIGALVYRRLCVTYSTLRRRNG